MSQEKLNASAVQYDYTIYTIKFYVIYLVYCSLGGHYIYQPQLAQRHQHPHSLELHGGVTEPGVPTSYFHVVNM